MANKYLTDIDSDALLVGRGCYIADLRLPGMVEVCFLRSDVARARINRLDVTLASFSPGVIDISTGADIRRTINKRLPWASPVLHASAEAPEEFHLPAYDLLPVEGVHYEGEPLAVIVAEDRYLAEDALELIDVEYDIQCPVLDPEFALTDGAEQLFEDVAGNLALEGSYGSESDPSALFDDAELVLERRYRMNRSGYPPLETMGVVAQYENGRLTVWSTTQRPHMVRIAIADILGLPVSKVRVIAPENLGGGFGWKSPMYREAAVVAWLAIQVGRPVRWIEDRTESLKKGIHERDQIWDMRAAFSGDGRLLALESEVIADVGSVLVDMYGLIPARLAVTVPFPYDVPWIRTHLRCAITNKAPMGVNRPSGRMPAVWAIERLMDEAARELGLSPFEIRRLNFVSSFPYVSPLGACLTDSDYAGTLAALENDFEWSRRRNEVQELRNEGRLVGLGLATCVEICRPLTSRAGAMFYNQPQYASVMIRMEPDGSVSVSSGDAPQGQARHSTMARVVAQELGVELGVVEVTTGDTKDSPITNSNTDVASVSAIAARQLREKVLRVARHLMGLSEKEELTIENGTIVCKSTGRSMTCREVAWRCLMRPFELPATLEPDLTVIAYLEAPYSPTSFSAHAAVVEIDQELGKIDILAYGMVGDTGKVLDHKGLRSALLGAIETGISNATSEAYVYDEVGQLVTSNLKDYAMLTVGGMPEEIMIKHHDSPTSSTVYGHKRSISEGAALAVPPAIANAISDALDGRCDLRVAPFHIGDVWSAMSQD